MAINGAFNYKLLQYVDIWTNPRYSSCPCQVPATGTLTYQISGLEAGKEYTFYIQLTSAYGKVGLITSFVQSMLTDVFLMSSTHAGLDFVILTFLIESGVGSALEVECRGVMGTFYRANYEEFRWVTPAEKLLIFTTFTAIPSFSCIILGNNWTWHINNKSLLLSGLNKHYIKLSNNFYTNYWHYWWNDFT